MLKIPTFTKFSSTTITILAILFIILYNYPSRTEQPHPTNHHPSDLIPKKLWYKVGPKGLSPDSETWLQECLHKNPLHNTQILTDETGDAYVAEHFANRPDIVHTYLSLRIPILKADLLRYLLLYSEGGVWSDLDVSCEVPIDDYVPAEYKSRAGLVVGWEFDVGWGENIIRQFASWTFMAQPGCVHLAVVIEEIVAAIVGKALGFGVQISELSMEQIGDIIDLTGPRRLTRGVFGSLGVVRKETFDVDSVARLGEAVLVEDVLILPGFSFAASSNNYEGWNVSIVPLVTHHYAGSWKNHNGGEL
jgi:mannosyltransferase OCH1-like enzyme